MLRISHQLWQGVFHDVVMMLSPKLVCNLLSQPRQSMTSSSGKMGRANCTLDPLLPEMPLLML